MVKVVLKDGSSREFADNISLREVAGDISKKLGKNALVAKVDGKLYDLDHKLSTGEYAIEILTSDDPESLDVYRHSSAHLLAHAIKRLYPEASLAIGPFIDKGYYYDIDLEHRFSEDDFPALEKEMAAIAKADYPIVREELSRDEAIQLFTEQNEPYKVILIQDLPEDAIISLYRQGDFVDLCAGPHLPSTGWLKAYKLLSLAGAYWRGDEKNKMLQRIYGTAFFKEAELKDYLFKMEEAKRRDHRKLGRELGLFILVDEGPGFPIFLPKGMIVRNELENYWREQHTKNGYVEIKTPIILNEELWHRSGHWDNYKDNMYFTEIDEETYCIKPMNCPGGILAYKSDVHSYRELPIRMAELGLVHRHEKSGVLHGLMRVRAFTQDDAHIYMLPSQITEEIIKVIDLDFQFYELFGFPFNVELSTRPEKSIGTAEEWEVATNALRLALDKKGIPYKVNEGDGAFYGPKIDFHLQDSIGRTWQCGTIQLDMQMPERFELQYIGEDGGRHRPVMIHRTIYGSIERFIGILTEHFAGAFPTWLAPVQVRILPITDRQHEYAKQLETRFKDEGIRVETDLRSEKIGYKIRDGQTQRIPYLLVVGDKEVENQQVAVRKRKEGDQGAQDVNVFLAELHQEINNRSL
ncbi:MAG: threonine--tRNA ligase [Candidatus Saccharibacteria bacterium]